ncbi:hypothetical protein [Bosea sp. Root381]|uniref:hypothetical protein n=1 Tax=Bosea sp. Root381 TaxID=1736524 RepID=UPI000B0AAB90|nr:hypothetical protein [Bosea sp. Root381]
MKIEIDKILFTKIDWILSIRLGSGNVTTRPALSRSQQGAGSMRYLASLDFWLWFAVATLVSLMAIHVFGASMSSI